jgi:outer membrane receptor for ferrienterochelin and colicin
MKKMYQIILISLLSGIIVQSSLLAQKVTLSGYIKDSKNGEALIGVSIYIKNTRNGTASNPYGFYSMSLVPGNYTIVVSSIGYQTIDTLINLSSSVTFNIELNSATRQLKEVEIRANRTKENVTSTKMSEVSLNSKTMKQIPVAYGEVDVLKILALLPGVKTSDEGGSAMSVRGGARDQNLILLDEATVYNASHLGNLLSVFNNDALQNVEFFKGNLPAQYGGRLSSVIDIRARDGNKKKFGVTGGIGTLSSRLTVEGPIKKDKGSFLISGRRAYIDLLTKAVHSVMDSFPVVPYYFYDLNLKANYTLSDKSRIFLSGYFGKDVFNMTTEDNNYKTNFAWGNYTGTFRWNYIPSKQVFTNLTLLVSNYNYLLDENISYGNPKKESKFNWKADLIDYSIKYDLGYYLSEKNTIRAGFISTLHDFNPGKIVSVNDTMKYAFNMPQNKALEHAVYISDEYHLTPKLTFELGMRFCLFQNIGKTKIFELNSEYETVKTVYTDKWEIYKTYSSPEPRFAVIYRINENSSAKAGYSRTSQFVHIASNASTGSILDLWVGSGPNIKPQMANLYSVGYFKNFRDNTIEASVEMYYKDMYNQIEFREYATPQFNERIDEDFRHGIGRAYGLEFLLRKQEGRLSGWLCYTYSKSERKIEGIQEKGWFPSSFDRTHDFTIVTMYNLTKHLGISANFQLKSGRPFTSPVKRYTYDGAVMPYYPKRNNDQMPLYHRLDLGISLHSSENSRKKFRNELVLSVFDVYNHVNPVSIYFRPDANNENITRAYKQNFLGLMPAITWNFSF